MNEDMSEILNKFNSILNSSNGNDNSNSSDSGSPSISPETISSMLQMLNSNKGASDKGSNDSSDGSIPNIDFETILKFKTVFDKMNSKDDPRARLLRALKPYLKDSRKAKVEQYIQFFNISKVIDLFGNVSGGDVKK